MRDGDWCSRTEGEMPVHIKKIEPDLLRLMVCHPVMVHTLSCENGGAKLVHGSGWIVLLRAA